jgi:hypothetical protein
MKITKKLTIELYAVDGLPTCCDSISGHRICPMLQLSALGVRDKCGWTGETVTRESGSGRAVPGPRCPLWSGK